jgi:hypothetical protein
MYLSDLNIDRPWGRLDYGSIRKTVPQVQA